MAYAQIHVQALRHPKVSSLTSDAFRLWVAGLVHCQEHLTDGIILERSLTNQAIGVRVTPALVGQLVANRLWDCISGVGYQVHDYLDWNKSREVVAHQREQAKERMKRARERAREQTVEVRQPIRNATQRDDPQRQDPERKPRATRARLEHDPEFEAFWALYPRKVNKHEADRAWRKLQPSPELQQVMLQALDRHVRQPNWLEDQGKFIPHCSTWINRRRWEDEIAVSERDRGGIRIVADEWRCPHNGEHMSRWACIRAQEIAALKAKEATG